MDGSAARTADSVPYIVECLLCAKVGTGRLSRGWVHAPADWRAGDRYFVCPPCAGVVRASGISIEYRNLFDSDLCMRVSWEILKDGKDQPLWRLDLLL